MERQNGEWEIIGDQTFLRLEREVHQQARWLGHRPLRLEATYWSAPTMCQSLPANWILGRSNIVGVKRNFQLIQDRIVDAWLTGLPDLPTENEPELAAIVMSEMPVFYTCAPDHPLLEKKELTVEDIAQFPSLALPKGCYPKVEAALKQLGLWNDGSRMTRYRRDRWEGRTEEELTIGYGTPLSMAVSGGSLCRLPLLLPFRSGEALVTRRDFLSHALLLELLETLQANLVQLASSHPEIEILIEQ